ncbi:MAG: patatin-like phospholipase family protein [Thermoanaerobaculum sp.]|nr:patatin-like phospholipase family protein [Thermoanaerobaculum sp.]
MGLLRALFRRGPKEGVVLALGGGGARGLAHLGVLQVLEEEEVPVVAVAGTSAGAVVGAMWLALGSTVEVRRRWEAFLAADFPSQLPEVRLTDEVSSRDNLLLSFAQRLQQGAQVVLALHRRSLVELADLDRAVAFLIPELAVEALPRPFAAVVTDFATGQAIALRRGNLRQAVAASSAVPGVVPPYPLAGRYVLDGGVVAEVPVAEAKALSPRPVVAVDVGDLPRPGEDPTRITLPRVLLRAAVMTHARLRAALVAEADLVIRPAVAGLHWSEFHRWEEAVAAGKSAAAACLNRLRALAMRRG